MAVVFGEGTSSLLYQGWSWLKSFISHKNEGPHFEVLMQEFPAFNGEQWKRRLEINAEEIEISEELKRKLDHPCPFWPGKKVRETHMLCLVPKGLSIQRLYTCYPEKPYSLFMERQEKQVMKSYWILITKNTIPGTEDLILSDQKDFLRKVHYQPPTFLEAAIAVVAARQLKNISLYPEHHYTCCEGEETDCPFIDVGSDRPTIPFDVILTNSSQYHGMAGVIRGPSSR